MDRTNVKMEVDNSFVVSDLKRKRCPDGPSFLDYFEEMTARNYKCRLCSIAIKYHGNGRGNLMRHFKKQHFTEWTALESLKKIPKPKKAKSNDSSSASESFSCDTTSTADMSSFDGNDPLIERASAIVEPRGQVKLMYPTVVDSLNNDIGQKVRSNGTGATVTDAKMRSGQIGGVGVMKDEHGIFGDYVASELRNMRPDQRRKLKCAFHKWMLDVIEEEEPEVE